jgi:hypothetical protein
MNRQWRREIRQRKGPALACSRASQNHVASNAAAYVRGEKSSEGGCCVDLGTIAWGRIHFARKYQPPLPPTLPTSPSESAHWTRRLGSSVWDSPGEVKTVALHANWERSLKSETNQEGPHGAKVGLRRHSSEAFPPLALPRSQLISAIDKSELSCVSCPGTTRLRLTWHSQPYQVKRGHRRL